MSKCDECGCHRQVTTDEISALKTITQIKDWFEWEELRWSDSRGPFSSSRGSVILVDFDLDYTFEYGDNLVWMVFQVDTEHYRVDGTKNSYGGTTWQDRVFLVREVPKTKKTWE